MPNNSEHHYDVGYKKPPVASRFQKGRSGNPRGRPKKEAEDFDPGNLLQSIDNEEVFVKINGKFKPMRKNEIYFRQLFTKALEGSLSDARLIANMASKYFGLEAEEPSEPKVVIAPDKKFIRNPGNDARNTLENSNRLKRAEPKEGRRRFSSGSQFRKVAKAIISIEVSGVQRKMPLWEAYLRHIYTMALSKNGSAARLLEQLRRQFPGDPLACHPAPIVISQADARL